MNPLSNYTKTTRRGEVGCDGPCKLQVARHTPAALTVTRESGDEILWEIFLQGKKLTSRDDNDDDMSTDMFNDDVNDVLVMVMMCW